MNTELRVGQLVWHFDAPLVYYTTIIDIEPLVKGSSTMWCTLERKEYEGGPNKHCLGSDLFAYPQDREALALRLEQEAESMERQAQRIRRQTEVESKGLVL